MKYLSICIFLSLALLMNNIRAQKDSAIIFNQIDSLIAKKDYYGAGILYKKLVFISNDVKTKNTFKILSTECFKKTQHYNDALDILNTVDLSEESDSIIFKTKYQLALLNYLSDDNYTALSHLQEMYLLIKDSSYYCPAYFLHALILNELYQWKESKTYMHKTNACFFSHTDENYNINKKIIDSMYHEKNFPKIKNPEKAMMISTFLPGGGQFYTHHYKEGLISFLSLSIISALTLTGIIYQYYFTSIVGGSALISKFYHGGISHTSFLAEKHNYEKTKNYNTTLKQKCLEILFKK